MWVGAGLLRMNFDSGAPPTRPHTYPPTQSHRTHTRLARGAARSDAGGAKNVLSILDKYSTNLKGKAATIDLAKTYTSEFASKVPAP